jgi:hypothetical protein
MGAKARSGFGGRIAKNAEGESLHSLSHACFCLIFRYFFALSAGIVLIMRQIDTMWAVFVAEFGRAVGRFWRKRQSGRAPTARSLKLTKQDRRARFPVLKRSP